MVYVKSKSVFVRAAAIGVCIALLWSCNRENSSTDPYLPTDYGTEPAVLTVSPIPLDKITDLEPLGAMQPSGHTFPTDHVYFYTNWIYGGPPPGPPETLAVLAPGNGVVTWILQVDGPLEDAKVMFRMNNYITYYLDHVVLDSSIKVGTSVTAGQTIGFCKSSALDLGLVCDTLVLPGFVNPARYGWQTLRTDSPYKYFSEPLRSQLYAIVRRNAPDKDGKIDYDVRGALIGNWFHESVSVASSMEPPSWPKNLAFCPDSNEPSEMRISIGGTISSPGKYKPSPEDLAFADVTVASGKVAYHLNYTESGYWGIMLVQLTDDTHLRVQVFKDSTNVNLNFTNESFIYSR